MRAAVQQRWQVAPTLGAAGSALLAVLLLVAASALYGGVALAVDGMGMPDAWLERLHLESWAWPGVALLISVALPQLFGGWRVWKLDPRAGLIGVAVGAALVLWIGAQALLLQRYFFLQPVVVGAGLLEMALSTWWIRRSDRAGSAARLLYASAGDRHRWAQRGPAGRGGKDARCPKTPFRR